MESNFQFFRSNTVQYYTVGEGDPLVLLHGYQADSRIWEKMIPLLQNNFQLIIPDLPGHGKSPLIQANNTMDFLAEVVFNISMSMGFRGINLAGHSLGGYVALAFADKYPNMTDKVFLINSHPFEDNMTRVLARNREAELIQDGKKEMLLRSFIQNNFSSFSTVHLKEEIDFATKIALSQPEDGMLADLSGMMARTRRVKIFTKPKQKVEFILGMADSRIPLKEFQAFGEDKLKIHWLTDCGHMSILEKPKDVTEIILSSVPR